MLTPYCTGMVVAWSRPANRLVTRHLTASTALGWAGVAMLCVGVFVIGGRDGMIMAVATAPFVGLAIWKVRPGPDDDDPPPPDAPEPPPPSPERIDRPDDRSTHHRRHRPRSRPVHQRRLHVK